VSSFNKPKRKNIAHNDDDSRQSNGGNLADRLEDNSEDKLSRAFKEITGEELNDDDRQHLFRIMQSMGVQDNDAIYSPEFDEAKPPQTQASQQFQVPSMIF
jgi:hypothetical protein